VVGSVVDVDAAAATTRNGGQEHERRNERNA